MSFSSRDSEEPTVNATRARQGRWGRPIVLVLLFGTILSALGMFAAWAWRDTVEGPPGPGQERVMPSATTPDTVAPPPATQPGQAYPQSQ